MAKKRGEGMKRIKCYWCRVIVEVPHYAVRVICERCTAGRAKLPSPDIVDRAWEGKAALTDILKTGFIPDL